MEKEDGIIEIFGNKYKIGEFNHETGAIEFVRIKKDGIFKRIYKKIINKFKGVNYGRN